MVQRNEQDLRSEGRKYALALALLVLIFVGVFERSATQSTRPQVVDESAVSQGQKAVLCSLEDSFSAIAQQVEPGVVSITAIQRPGPAESSSSEEPPDALNDFFRRFFDEEMGESDGVQDRGLPPGHPEAPVTAAGSGTLVRRAGADFYVLTNYHVVEDAYRVSVRLQDDTVLTGTVVGTDPVTDLAVVRISSPRLTDQNIIAMGDSNKVKVGSWVLAVGSPYGFAHTLTVGVVSALNRELEEENTVYPDLIQTDAAINKGNSGGPLLDIEGRIIGINTAIASPTGGFIGLGFAIPINTAKAVLDKLISEGRVIRGWLGVGIQELTPTLQEYYGVKKGVLVASVDGKGPAAKAGIASEDIIVRVEQISITDPRQLQRLIADAQPGSTVTLATVRGGRERPARVQIGLSPSTPKGRPAPPPAGEGAGIRVRTLREELASAIGLKGVKGALVVDVSPGSPAEAGGLSEGDVIISFNGREVVSEAQFADMLENMRPGGLVVLKVIRKGSSRIIGFRME